MTPAGNHPNPRYTIVRAESTHLLVQAVDPKLQDGVWECVGAPFFDTDRREWCQAIARPHLAMAAAKVKR